ncbi:carbohydrate ABC transporter permease [uncultured Alsobacter sp.]|uniref:carbohydrate ABC transporter permease n=1 Tax=uncultured Alsobacter sp. TaxID=1748258 RepID=UPI0025EC0536|nr:carbohydrate ABC transporter permease [uncultured Alsobacter sp.]
MISQSSLARRVPFSLRALTLGFLALWIVIALFPLLWITVMSFRLPVDALASNPLTVLLGPRTLAAGEGLSILDALLSVAVFFAVVRVIARQASPLAARLSLAESPALGWLLSGALLGIAALVVLAGLLPPALRLAAWLVRPIPGVGMLAEPVIGFTARHYVAVWAGHGFWRNFVNSLTVTAGVVTISLTFGTLAGYAFARNGSRLAFFLLIAALIFRALPNSTLVAGYLPFFVRSRELLQPLWDAPVLGSVLSLFAEHPPTLYGKPIAVIAALVAINQPFTIWMLRSFFQTVPSELDEAARVDGCSHFGAFRRVIMPVMWPGVITTGLFSFLLAYNDYLVCALLLDAQSQTMVPAISQFFNRETTSTDQIEAIAAAVSITAPLFLLVMVFQKQIVSGLTAGAVKG